MDKTNKELIKELTEYFCTQDPKIVAKLLASCMIDLNRCYTIEYLSISELQSLKLRMWNNMDELRKFSENGPSGNLTLRNLDSDIYG